MRPEASYEFVIHELEVLQVPNVHYLVIADPMSSKLVSNRQKCDSHDFEVWALNLGLCFTHPHISDAVQCAGR